jgi:hypothetical protein
MPRADRARLQPRDPPAAIGLVCLSGFIEDNDEQPSF